FCSGFGMAERSPSCGWDMARFTVLSVDGSAGLMSPHCPAGNVLEVTGASPTPPGFPGSRPDRRRPMAPWTGQERTASAAAPRDEETDAMSESERRVVVIGGGALGVSTAAHLARQG